MKEDKASPWGDPVVLASFIAALTPLIKELIKWIKASNVSPAKKQEWIKQLSGK